MRVLRVWVLRGPPVWVLSVWVLHVDPAGVQGASLREQLDALERNLIAGMLARTGGNQSEAARRLGLSRTAFIDRMKKYGLG